MAPDAHERYENELAAYMLGALEADRGALRSSSISPRASTASGQERWLRASVDVLPSSVEQVEPPPALRERLMETVRREAGVPHEAARPHPAGRAAGGRLRTWLGSLSLRPATALAGVVLLLAAGVAGYAIGDGGGGSDTTRIDRRRDRGRPADDGHDRAQRRCRRPARGNLPQRRGRIYEVWLVKDGKPRAVRALPGRSRRHGLGGIPDGLDEATQVMVTSEPAGGSDQPTTQPLLERTPV